MKLTDTCTVQVFLYIYKKLQTQKTVTFDEVMAAPGCKRYSIKEIGQALELLRRNELIKASSRYGCSELLEFTASAVTEKGQEFFEKHH